MRTDFVRKYAAKAAKIRRSKRQSKKNFVVYYTIGSAYGMGLYLSELIERANITFRRPCDNKKGRHQGGNRRNTVRPFLSFYIGRDLPFPAVIHFLRQVVTEALLLRREQIHLLIGRREGLRDSGIVVPIGFFGNLTRNSDFHAKAGVPCHKIREGSVVAGPGHERAATISKR